MPSSVGSLVQAAREKRGWSLAELARRSGVSRSLVSRIESGRMSGSLETVVGIAGVLDIDLNLLKGAGLEDEPTVSP